MSRTLRTTIIVFVGAAAAAAYVYCRAQSTGLSESQAGPLLVAQHWLLGLLVLYGVNFLLAVRLRHSFSVNATRMLFFAVAAFIVLSHGIDILAEHRSTLFQVFGIGEGTATATEIAPVRARLAAMASMLTMCLVCIAVGFESEIESPPRP